MVRICVIEDEPNIIEAMRYLFESEGWEVVVESDGAKAVAVIDQIRPNLVVLDYMLPNQSGLTVARELRDRDATATLPILMLSAKGQHKDKE
ncbi:MAG: response regulator transcription factor, partial [Candidatus Puniceispirillaceae bacterium]